MKLSSRFALPAIGGCFEIFLHIRSVNNQKRLDLESNIDGYIEILDYSAKEKSRKRP